MAHSGRGYQGKLNPPRTTEPLPNNDEVRWFATEVYPHDASLKAYLRSSFPAVHDWEDVVQESYLRIWRNRAAAPIRSAKAFLFTVARRVALDLLRRDRRSPIAPVKEIEQLFVIDDAPHAAEVVSRTQDVQMLVDAIDSLPARCREIFVLCQIEGCTQKEVAQRLGLSESTVAVQSARGLQRCEKFIRQRLKQP
ncbi:MAG: RNA polymerase sigma factor [Opitutae bacterium]|nr:RNA polymerase sigma factor [Opitutae bacterium]